MHPRPGQQIVRGAQVVVVAGLHVCAAVHWYVVHCVPVPIVVTIAATPPPQSDAKQQAPHVLSEQQYGLAVSPLPDWHCAFEQHCRQPIPGQHVVPLLQPLTYSHFPFEQRLS